MSKMSSSVLGSTGCLNCASADIGVRCFLDQLDIPPGEHGHELSYSHLALVICRTCRGGHVEKRQHDCFDIEDVFDQHEWYVLDAADMLRLSGMLEACPQPLEPCCPCPVHDSQRSSALALTTSSWSSGLEGLGDWHVHQVALEILQGLPSLKPK